MRDPKSGDPAAAVREAGSRQDGQRQAGEASPHLDKREQRHAAAAKPVGPLVIHEIVREQGEAELQRSFSGLAWSGVAAGASIGFSFVVQASLQAGLPDAPWSPLVAGGVRDGLHGPQSAEAPHRGRLSRPTSRSERAAVTRRGNSDAIRSKELAISRTGS
jgi:hypothetical protein